MKSFLNDFLSVGVSKFLMVAFGLGTSIIVARTLGPDKNGTIAALLVYPSLFMTIGSLGIRQSATYFLGKNVFSEEEIKTAIVQIWLVSSVISIVICFLLMRYISNIGGNLYLVILALIPIPFSLFNTYNSGIFMGKNQISTFNKINWIPLFIIFLLTLLLVVMLSMDIVGYMIALIGGPFFIFFILLFRNKFIHFFSFTCNWRVINKMLSLGLTYAFALLIINLNYKIDVILLDKLSTPYETGIYARGSGIIQYLWEIPMLLSTIVFARSAVAKNEHNFSLKVTQLLRVSIIVVSFLSLVLVAISKPLIVGMYGNDFIESVSVLNLLIPGVLLLTVFKVMNMDLAGRGKPWVSLKAMTPALALNLLLNFMWIPKYGADGAAFASTLSYSVAAMLFLYFYSEEVKIPVKEILRFDKADFAPILQKLGK